MSNVFVEYFLQYRDKFYAFIICEQTYPYRHNETIYYFVLKNLEFVRKPEAAGTVSPGRALSRDTLQIPLLAILFKWVVIAFQYVKPSHGLRMPETQK